AACIAFRNALGPERIFRSFPRRSWPGAGPGRLLLQRSRGADLSRRIGAMGATVPGRALARLTRVDHARSRGCGRIVLALYAGDPIYRRESHNSADSHAPYLDHVVGLAFPWRADPAAQKRGNWGSADRFSAPRACLRPSGARGESPRAPV